MSKIFRQAFLMGLGPLVFLTLSLSLEKPLGATFYGEGLSSGQHEMEFRNGKYLVYLPSGFNADSRYPLVFIPHVNFSGRGAIEPDRLMEGWKSLADERKYIVVLASAGGVFLKLDEWYVGLLEEIRLMYSINRSRVLVTGFGDGAHYALHLGVSYPEEFTAVAPVAGTLEGWWKRLMKFKTTDRPGLYFLSGAEDTVVRAEEVEEAAREMEQKGYVVKFEKVEDVGHAYSDAIILKIADWFDGL